MAGFMRAVCLSLAALCLGAQVRADFTSVESILTTPIAFGSATINATTAFVGGSDGSHVGVYETYDGETMDLVPIDNAAMIAMTIASDREGNVLAGGLFGAAKSTDNGASYTSVNSDFPHKMLASQDMKYQNGRWTIAGQFFVPQAADGVMVSSDDLASWEFLPVDGLYKPGLRYASMPSENVIYATAGMWNDTATDSKAHAHLTARLFVDKKGSVKTAGLEAVEGSDAGWWGQVVKSSDGGQTWDVVYQDIDAGYYYNDIHCFDEDTCTFVMEGLYQPKIMTTTDGGVTWNTALVDDKSSSLMMARMVDQTSAWAAGGGDVGRMWSSSDLASWDESTTTIQQAASFTSLDVDVDDGVIYATGILRSQLSTVLKLTI